MVNCPQCNATLPPGSVHCQFCGASFGAAPPGRPGAPGARPTGHYAGRRGLEWVPIAYTLVSIWWIVDGGLSVARGLSTGSGSISLGMIFGALTALVGLGLLLKVEFVRGIVNFLSFFQILFGLFDVVVLFFLSPIVGIWGPIGMILAFIRVGVGGLMIFLIGETETRGPNL